MKSTLSFDGENEPVVCTPEHPFYVLNTSDDRPIVLFEGRDESKYEGQWVAAKYLKVGDKVLLSNGKTDIIKAAVTEECEEFTTYNFEVADFHTYYVGEQGILVHNACPVFDTPEEAYAAAKKDLGLGADDLPIDTKIKYYDNGKGYYSPQTTDIYSGNRAIVHHGQGHFYPDTGQFIPKHYNAGMLSNNAKGFSSNGIHYFYRR